MKVASKGHFCQKGIEVSNIVLNLIFRSEPLRAQRSTIVRSIPYSKQDDWSAPQSENMLKSFFMPSSPTGSYYSVEPSLQVTRRG